MKPGIPFDEWVKELQEVSQRSDDGLSLIHI